MQFSSRTQRWLEAIFCKGFGETWKMHSVLSVCNQPFLHFFFLTSYFEISLISLLLAHIIDYDIVKCFMV